MAALDRGLYEVLITEALDARLSQLGNSLQAIRGDLRAPEVADRIGLHLARVVGRAIAAIDERERTAVGIDLARRLIDMIRAMPAAGDLAAEQPLAAGELLRSIVGRLPDGRPESIAAPMIPLLDTTLLTNAPGEPRVGHQIGAEVHSADRVDVVMAFIRRSGITPLMEALRVHCAAARPLRVLTTTYTGSTEARALDELRDAGAPEHGNAPVSPSTSCFAISAEELINALTHIKDFFVVARGSAFSSAQLQSLRFGNTRPPCRWLLVIGSDIEFRPGQALIRRGKTDAEGQGRVAYLSCETVEWLKIWFEHAKISDGPIFRRLIGRDQIGEALHPESIAPIFKRVAQWIGMPERFVAGVSGHSTRVGAAQDLAELDIDLAAITQAGGWKSTRMPLQYAEKIKAARSGMARAAAASGRDEAVSE